jgi:hypothetical protein
MCPSGMNFFYLWTVVSVDAKQQSLAYLQYNTMRYQGPRYHIRRNIDLKRTNMFVNIQEVCGLSSVKE